MKGAISYTFLLNDVCAFEFVDLVLLVLDKIKREELEYKKISKKG